MTALVHPAFFDDLRRFTEEYRAVYENLGHRFNQEVRQALLRVKAGPEYAGHLLKTRPITLKDVRRCNLRSFPFFVLYGLTSEVLLIASLLPSRSDPLTWLSRFQAWDKSEGRQL